MKDLTTTINTITTYDSRKLDSCFPFLEKSDGPEVWNKNYIFKHNQYELFFCVTILIITKEDCHGGEWE